MSQLWTCAPVASSLCLGDLEIRVFPRAITQFFLGQGYQPQYQPQYMPPAPPSAVEVDLFGRLKRVRHWCLNMIYPCLPILCSLFLSSISDISALIYTLYDVLLHFFRWCTVPSTENPSYRYSMIFSHSPRWPKKNIIGVKNGDGTNKCDGILVYTIYQNVLHWTYKSANLRGISSSEFLYIHIYIYCHPT